MLVKISRLIIYIRNIINFYLLATLKIKLYESKNSFIKNLENKNLKSQKNKEFSERKAKDI